MTCDVMTTSARIRALHNNEVTIKGVHGRCFRDLLMVTMPGYVANCISFSVCYEVTAEVKQNHKGKGTLCENCTVPYIWNS